MLSRFGVRWIIYRHVPRRSAFDRTNYVDYYEPWVHKRPARQAKWDDPDYSWPPTIPPPTPHGGRFLIRQLEQDYMNQTKLKFEVPKFRTGDELEVENFYSLSGQKFSTFKGVCIAKRRWQSLHASFNVIGSKNGMTMEMSFKVFSPMLKNVRVLEYGSGNLRARLNYFRDLPIMKFPAVKKSQGWRSRISTVAKEEEKKKRLMLLRSNPTPDTEE